MKKLLLFIGVLMSIFAGAQIVTPPGFTRLSQKYIWLGVMPPTDTLQSKYGFAGLSDKPDSVYWGNGTYWRNISRGTPNLAGDSVYQRTDSVFYKTLNVEHFSGIVLQAIQWTDPLPGDHNVIGPDGKTIVNQRPTDQACDNTTNIGLSHINGLVYAYPSGFYNIACVQYAITTSATFALDAFTGSPGQFRTDAVVLQAGSGIVILKGDNSDDQVGGTKTVDPATQILLSYITINSDGVVINVSSTTIYYDNLAGEWTHTIFGAPTINFAYGTNPLAPSDSSIRLTVLPNNSGFRFTSPTTQSSAGKRLTFFIRHDATVNNARNWVLRKMNGINQVSGSAAITLTAQRGYNKTAAFNTQWQLISIDMADFGGQDAFTGFEWRNTATGGTVNQQIDSIRVESGVNTTPASGSQNSATTYTANQNAAHVDQPNDNINILGGRNIYTRADGLKTIMIEDGVNTTDNNNFKKDSIVLYTPPDYTHTFTAAGWTKAANFNTFATETVVAGGVQIASSHTGIGTDWIYAPWHSMADNTTMEMTFTLDVIGGSNPLIGFVRNSFGAITVGGIMYLALDEININGSTAGFNHWNLHDLIRMRFSLDYSTFKVDVYNITQNKFDSYTYAGSNYAYITTSAPAIYITNATITVKDFRFYSRNYNPDLMIAGDSHWLQAGGSVPIGYDSTTGGRIQANSNLNVSVFAKSSATLPLFLASFPEFKKLKPKKVLFDVGFVNVFNGDPVGTWGPLYQAAVDSILNMGCKVILVRDFPATTTETAPIGLFVDSIYANDTDVNIIDLYATTPMYDAGDAFHHDAAYFEPDIYGHPNNAGAKAIADYILPRLKNFGRYRSAGGGGGGGGGGTDSPDRINGTATIDVNSDVTGHYQRFLYDHGDGHTGYLQFSSGDEGLKSEITDGTITMRTEMSFDAGFLMRYIDGSGTYQVNMNAAGLNYNTDISAAYTDRSLPDVGGVKKIVSDTAQNIISNLLIVFKGTATLNFGSTSASSSNDLTITATGASVGDPVSLGLPASIDANSTYTAWVSATNTVTVRFNNYQSVGAIDPASGTFKVIVYKY